MPQQSQTETHSEVFSSAEELEEVNRREGFGVAYRQLAPGPFSAEFAVSQAGAITAFREHFRSRLEIAGDPVPGMVTVVVASSETPAVFNGRHATPDRLFVWTEGAEIDAAIQPNLEGTTFIVPTAVFENTLAQLHPDHGPLPRAQAMCLSPGGAFVRSLTESVQQLTLGEVEEAQRRRLGQRILDAVASTVARRHVEAAPRRPGSPGITRTVVRAKRYVDAHLDAPVSMSDLCQHCGVGVRVLQRHFAEGLGVTPSRYILARRLNHARRELLRRQYRPGVVSTTALDAGFNHLGRFSGVYRDYFGELPQETATKS